MPYDQRSTRACSRRDVIRLLGRAAVALPAASIVSALAYPARTLASDASSREARQLNVMDYGATGDGVADDTIAIAKALAAGRDIANAVVYFPAGTYLVTKALGVAGPVAISGESAAATQLRLRSDWGFLYLSNTSHVSIANLTFDGGEADGSYGIWINDASNVTVTGCRFVHIANCGVSLQRVNVVSLAACAFDTIGWSGVRLEDPGDGNANRNVAVHDCAFTNVVTSGLLGHAAVQASDNAAAVNEYLSIQNNVVQSLGVGLGLDSMNFGTVSGNRIIGNGARGEGIAFCGAHNVINGNTINNNFAAGILQWAVAYRANAGNAITGNVCYDNAEGIAVVCANDGTVVQDLTIAANRCYSASSEHPQKWGVQSYIDGTTSFQWINVHITGNDLRGNTIGGLYLAPPSTATVADNWT